MYGLLQIVVDAVAALVRFPSKYPQYQGRDLYIGGEGSDSILVLKLARMLVQRLSEPGSSSTLALNWKGLLIGNGWFGSKWHVHKIRTSKPKITVRFRTRRLSTICTFTVLSG